MNLWALRDRFGVDGSILMEQSNGSASSPTSFSSSFSLESISSLHGENDSASNVADPKTINPTELLESPNGKIETETQNQVEIEEGDPLGVTEASTSSATPLPDHTSSPIPNPGEGTGPSSSSSGKPNDNTTTAIAAAADAAADASQHTAPGTASLVRGLSTKALPHAHVLSVHTSSLDGRTIPRTNSSSDQSASIGEFCGLRRELRAVCPREAVETLRRLNDNRSPLGKLQCLRDVSRALGRDVDELMRRKEKRKKRREWLQRRLAHDRSFFAKGNDSGGGLDGGGSGTHRSKSGRDQSGGVNGSSGHVRPLITIASDDLLPLFVLTILLAAPAQIVPNAV